MEINGKPLWMPWSEEEFQGDVFVRGMNWLQRHLYRTLLQSMFFHSARPYLPNDDEILWILAGAESPEMWVQNKATVLRRFTKVPDNENLLEQKRVTSDWNKLVEMRDQKSEMGLKSAAVRKSLYGTAQPGKILVPNGNRTDAEPVPNGGSESVQTGAELEKLSEVKVSEGKLSKEKPNTPGQGSFSNPEPEHMAAALPNWHNLSTRHKRLLGKPVSSPARHKEKYVQFCDQYGEDIVLQCFDAWAPTKREWANDPKSQPIFQFWKDLPDLADDLQADKESEKEQAAAVRAAELKAEQDKKFQEESIARQVAESQARWAAHPQVNEMSLEDLMGPELMGEKCQKS
jgi:hypothetical protein